LSKNCSLSRHIYGYDGNLANNLFVIQGDEKNNSPKIIYTAGDNVVFYDPRESKDAKINQQQVYSQQFIHGTVGSTGITCMQLSPSKRYFAE